MIPVVFINCASAPYVDDIMSRSKYFETRSRDMLRSLVGRRVLIAETHRDRPPVVRCSARIESGFPIYSRESFELFRDWTCIPEGAPHDWKETTTVKWFYFLADAKPVRAPFIPAEGARHGRVWMEYNGKKVIL